MSERGGSVAQGDGCFDRCVDELFFGKDRLEAVEGEIVRQRARPT